MPLVTGLWRPPVLSVLTSAIGKMGASGPHSPSPDSGDPPGDPLRQVGDSALAIQFGDISISNNWEEEVSILK